MTTFNAMTAAERSQWLAWAQSHDWGQKAIYMMAIGGQYTLIIVLGRDDDFSDECAGGCSAPDTRATPAMAGFFSPCSLRNWAGY